MNGVAFGLVLDQKEPVLSLLYNLDHDCPALKTS